MRYLKPALTFADQVALLQARGLRMEDHSYAEEVLSHVSYYRMSAYFRPFRQAGSERFANASFSDVLELYKFDKDLRLMVSDTLESIEVHFRTRLTYHLALRGGAFAHIDPIYFLPTFDHTKFLSELRDQEKKSSDKFVVHFRKTYVEERFLPIWMSSELMSFGFLSRIFSKLTTDLQREIAGDFNVHQSVLRNWLHTLSYVRNICAHHGRLWNREMSITFLIPNARDRWKYLGVEPKRCYGLIVLICDILSRISDSTRCKDEFAAHLSTANPMQLAGMWVPKNWTTYSPWFVGPKFEGLAR
jgi:abortive infection bacteriophage resistance protein